MKGSRFLALAAAAVAATMVMGFAGAEPSGGCNGGEAPPSTTPLGVGIDQAGDPTTGSGSLRVCNTGSTVPAPAKGAVTVSGNPTGQSGYVDVDGDSNNAGAPCTDGFVRVGASAGGPAFYESPSGSWSGSSPNKAPDVWAQNLVNNCAGPLPAP